MLTIYDTALNDNQVVWIAKLSLDPSTVLYFSTANNGITLGGTLYDGKVILKDSVSEVDKYVGIEGGGTIGNRGNFSLSLARYNSYSGASNFFNSFYPATSGKYLTSRKVEFGVLWDGATTTGEITWLGEHYINEVSYNASSIELFCIEYDELVAKELPYYSVQNETDNGISYFVDAPEESLKESIPIVYGEFDDSTTATLRGNMRRSEFTPAPGILVDKSKIKFVFASHKAHTMPYGTVFTVTDQYYLFSYVPNVDSYMAIYSVGNTSGVNSHAGVKISLLNAVDELIGEMYINLSQTSTQSGISNTANIINKDETDYAEINAGEKVALRLKDILDTSNSGILSKNAPDVAIAFIVSTDGGGNRAFKINYLNDALETPTVSFGTTGTLTSGTATTKSYSIGSETATQQDGKLPWEASEATGLDCWIENTEVTAGNKIRVYAAYMYLTNIKVIFNNPQRRYLYANYGARLQQIQFNIRIGHRWSP